MDFQSYVNLSRTPDVVIFAEEALSDIAAAVNLAQVKVAKKTKSFPFIALCMAKLADFEGTTLKPEKSGKCDIGEILEEG